MYYTIKPHGEEYRVRIEHSTYAHDGSLAICMTCDDGIPYGAMTVNLDSSRKLAADEAFVDTNNGPWIPAFLAEHGLAVPTGKTARSGWCEYPIYKFDLEKIPHI